MTLAQVSKDRTEFFTKLIYLLRSRGYIKITLDTLLDFEGIPDEEATLIFIIKNFGFEIFSYYGEINVYILRFERPDYVNGWVGVGPYFGKIENGNFKSCSLVNLFDAINLFDDEIKELIIFNLNYF